jgi:hypothetical protein
LLLSGKSLQELVSSQISISTTPIPPALLLFGSALAGLGFLGRRRRATARPLA